MAIFFPVTLYTLGCKLNQLESEALADSFRQAGFPLVPPGAGQEAPGLVIINTCTVTSKADQKCRRLIRKMLRTHLAACVIVTGCYAQLDSDEIKLLEDEIGEGDSRRLFVMGGGAVGVGGTAGASKSRLLDLPEYLLKAADIPLPQALEVWAADAARKGNPFEFKPKEFAFHSRGYLKIQDGCDNCCTYCRVRLARGSSVSLPKEAALAQLQSFEERGCAELMITGVNITQYQDSSTDLTSFLEYLLEGSSTIALRLASLEPERIDKRLAAVCAHPRIRPHFHLSVQSGSDTVLSRMGRAYTAQTVAEGAALLRGVKDKPFLACDIIAGFPGETDAEFAETLALCEKIGFAWIHAFPYSKRPGTKAFLFENPVHEQDITRRVETMTQLAVQGRRCYAQRWLGREVSAVVERSDSPTGIYRAVSENYLKLIVNCAGQGADKCAPGTAIRCVPVALCEGADGEKPDAVAKFIREDLTRRHGGTEVKKVGARLKAVYHSIIPLGVIFYLFPKYTEDFFLFFQLWLCPLLLFSQ